MARRLRSPWPQLVVVMTLLAGFLFGTSAHTARGTDLRSGRRLRLTELIALEQRRVAALDRRASVLRRDVEGFTAAAAAGDSRVRAARAAAGRLAGPVGLEPVEGPGVVVTLDDAPRLQPGVERPGNPTPDDLVVHEQDVLAVINALWTGGAEAITVMGDRIINTSAVRCVGNTLLLHDAVYSPPFVIAAIGDPDLLVDALDASPGVGYFESFVAAYGLGYEVVARDEIEMPAYDGPLRVRRAVPVP